jgi:sortase (surface protein transpeptidase)
MTPSQLINLVKSKKAVFITAFLLFGVFSAGLLVWNTNYQVGDNKLAIEISSEPSHMLEVDDAGSAVQPVRLTIPAIDLATNFTVPLGLSAGGEVEVPEEDDLVGWYRYSPVPGRLGPAVILGHVDSFAGPAVFYRLGSLKVGDEILVENSDGTEARFIVTELERPTQNAFPTARVYGDIDHAGLRLITCSGIYERGSARYTHNLIVYARLTTEGI